MSRSESPRNLRFMQTLLGCRTLTIALLAASVAAPVGGARAAESAPGASANARETVRKLNEKALEQYENLAFDQAQQTLRWALDRCARASLDKHPVAAEAHLLLGIVLLVDPENHDDAMVELEAAFAIDAAIAVPERIANPEIRQALAEARASVATADSSATPQPARRASPRAAHEADDDADADADAVPDDSRAGARRATPESPAWFSAVAFGGGLGWSGGTAEVNSDLKVPTGVHPASVVHLVPEVGYFISPQLLVSLQLRVQIVSGATALRDPTMTMCGADHVCSPAKGALALFARAAWLAKGRTLRPYLAVLAGVGQIRHQASLPGHADCGDDAAHPVNCVDTVVTGPILLGGGGGLILSLGHRFGLTLGVNAVVGVPSYTFNVDLNGGVALEL